MLKEEIIDKLKHYRTINIGVNIHNRFELDNVRYEEDNIIKLYLDHIINYEKTNNPKILDRISNLKKDILKQNFTNVQINIYKNTSKETIEKYIKLIDDLLEEYNNEFVESDIYKELYKVFKEKTIKIDRKPKENISHPHIDEFGITGYTHARANLSNSTLHFAPPYLKEPGKKYKIKDVIESINEGKYKPWYVTETSPTEESTNKPEKNVTEEVDMLEM